MDEKTSTKEKKLDIILKTSLLSANAFHNENRKMKENDSDILTFIFNLFDHFLHIYFVTKVHLQLSDRVTKIILIQL